MKPKTILLVPVAFGLGGWMLYSGIQANRNNQRLSLEGKVTTAEVLDRSVKLRTRGGARYYLSVKFTPEGGESFQGQVMVNHSEYLNYSIGSNPALRYVSSNPSICAVGEPVPVWRAKLVSGALLLLSAGVLLALNRGRPSMHEAATKIASHVGALCEPEYKYAVVSAKEFGHLDLSWYDASQRWLEQNGFALLGDEENLTFQRTSGGNRTLLRTMLNRDGTSLAYLYHFKPSAPACGLTGDGLKILELQTHFANCTFICTSNAEAAGKLDSPPGVDASHLLAASSLESILSAHEQRVADFLANNTGVGAGRMSSLEDVHRVQNTLQQIKAAYRRNTGITQKELQRLAGNRLAPEQIAALHADVEQLRAEQNGAGQEKTLVAANLG